MPNGRSLRSSTFFICENTQRKFCGRTVALYHKWLHHIMPDKFEVRMTDPMADRGL